MMYCDIRFIAAEDLPTYLRTVSERVLSLTGCRANYELCLLGTTPQTAPVITTLTPCEWHWATPYNMLLDSATHTLANDLASDHEVHPVCMDAYANGDNTFAVHQGVIFRFLRDDMTDSQLRGREPAAGGPYHGTGAASWNAGRNAFRQHRDRDVPFIKDHTVTREPYHFALNLSTSLPHAGEFPLEFGIANYLYWHSRPTDIVLVLNDDLDLFGTTALYCERRVVMAPVWPPNTAPVHNLPLIMKAYETMALLSSGPSGAFWSQYPADAKFATVSRLTRNTRGSAVTAQGILRSQTAAEKER